MGFKINNPLHYQPPIQSDIALTKRCEEIPIRYKPLLVVFKLVKASTLGAF